MGIVTWLRHDLRLRVVDTGGTVRAEVGWVPRGRRRRAVPRPLLDAWLAAPQDPGPPLQLAADLGLPEAVAEWRAGLDALPHLRDADGNEIRPVGRAVLEMMAPRLDGLPWEALAAGAGGSGWPPAVVVRASPVRPRAAQVPLSLPLRLLQVDAAAGWSLAEVVRGVFARYDDTAFARAVRVARAASAGLDGWVAPEGWPRVDVLHLDPAPWRARPDLLSTARPEEVGTLGWLMRVTDLWQTRLVVIADASSRDAAALRALAAAVAARGGPAVLVGPPDADPGRFDPFYDRLIHDTPVDAALAAIDAGEGPPTLVVGAGRAELLRVSSPGRALLALRPRHETAAARGGAARRDLWTVIAPALGSAPPEAAAEALRRLWREVARRASSETVAMDRFRRALRRFGDAPAPGPEPGRLWAAALAAEPRLATAPPFARAGLARRLEPLAAADRGDVDRALRRLDGVVGSLDALGAHLPGYHFADHEGDGLVPLSAELEAMRAGMEAVAVPELRPAAEPGPRFANPALWRSAGAGRLERIDPAGARVAVGKPCLFGVQIGPRDRLVPVHDAAALIEEAFKWHDGKPGVWLDVAVTGLDCAVLGHPVQELWLPRGGASDVAMFTVVPRRDGVSRLRFTLHYGPDLLQSFLFAIVTGEAGRDDLGRALGMPAARVAEAGYQARLEYAATGDLARPPARAGVALGVVANRLDGRPVVTIKGRDFFSEASGGDLPDRVVDVRRALEAVSMAPTPPGGGPAYAFLHGGRLNDGDPETLHRALGDLATAGWDLFQRLVPAPARNGIAAALADDRSTIHVAHTLLETVIPWAAVYDRPYDPDAMRHDGEPVAHEACLAALPGPDGRLPAGPCGAHPDCPLAPANQAARRARGEPVGVPHTVACPRHFWGFRHVIEVPPQQVAPDEPPPPRRDRITAARPASLLLGYNAVLVRAADHVAALAGLHTRIEAHWQSLADRDAFLTALESPDLDVVYLYCHARGGAADPAVRPPQLELQESPAAAPGRIRASALAGPRWRHNPLVFLNGCNTAAFSPDALSPFIRTLVRDCGAAGAVGTEVPVWEQLATEVAELFLTRLLDGEAAGPALLDTRLALLRRHNPLGLVYTLYAAADLAFADA